MKDLIFVLRKLDEIKEELSSIHEEISSLKVEETDLESTVSSQNEGELKNSFEETSHELEMWSEIEKLATMESSRECASQEILKRKEKLASFEGILESFSRLEEIQKSLELKIAEYKRLSQEFIDGCLALQEAYATEKSANNVLAGKIRKILETLEDTSKVTEAPAVNNKVVDVESESDSNQKRIEVTSTKVVNPLELVANYMAQFDMLYKEANGIPEGKEIDTYLAGYHFLFERCDIQEAEKNAFKKCIESDVPFPGLNQEQTKSLLWALPKNFLLKVNLSDIISERDEASSFYLRGALNRPRPTFTYKFVREMLEVVRDGNEEKISEFFSLHTDTYVKKGKFSFPKALERELPRIGE